MKLYSHQAELFEATYREGAKLILYQAPVQVKRCLQLD